MMNDRLKPFVHKIKGAKNYAFYDMLNGDLYHFEPVGSIEDARKQLKEAGLIFETETFVPFKTRLNVIKKEDNLFLRKLQVRINGNGEDTCWKRIKNKYQKNPMNQETARKIVEEFQGIPCQKLIIEGESLDEHILSILVTKLDFAKAELNLENEINKELFKLLRELSKKEIETQENRKYSIKELNVEANDFFYHQEFNPCLGHQIAIDTGREIKPCLWWPSDLGNIHDTGKIKDMIISGKFDKYWEMNKDRIEVCSECEYRYNCMDCRIHSHSLNDNFSLKPSFCNYDPYTGAGDSGDSGIRGQVHGL
jgi:radical SAM protein with 4Fe4S-binding SPASM domain